MSGDIDIDGDVVVVGGGIIGLACAWRLAQRGATVTVVDPAPGGGASHVAAGMLAPITEVHYGEEALLALNLDSARRWPAFAADLADASGQPVDFEAGGTLAVAFDNDDRVALDALGDHLERLELAVRRLRPRDVRALEPMLAPTVRGGLVADGDHRVDPRTVISALVEAGRRAGVEFVASSVSGVECEPVGGDGGCRVRAVHLADGGRRLAAATVVLATGAGSPDLDGLARADRAPLRPVKGQILTVRCPPGEALLTRAVRGLVHGSGVYLVPRPDGRIVIGATVEEQGWDARPTAGAVYELLRDASLLVPGISECELVETLVGFRPGTPDNAPVLGASPAAGGLVHAVGHFRNGVLLAPVTADAIAEVVATGRTPDVIAPFGISRFDGGGATGDAVDAASLPAGAR
ncbi:MAG: glycine oxidase ThiO [Acidimicrobiales bacterium]